MAQNEKPNSHDDFHSDHAGEDDYVLDAELKEIQAQLESDANHLQSLYPPCHSGQLDQLIQRCMDAAEAPAANRDLENQNLVPEHLVSPSSSTQKTTAVDSNPNGMLSRRGRLYQFASAICIMTLLVGSIAYLWNRPHRELIEEPIVSRHTEPEVFLVPAVSVSSMPPELMNASQPELEALYDEMPSESVSIEY